MKIRRTDIETVLGLGALWLFLLPYPYRFALEGHTSTGELALLGIAFPMLLLVLFCLCAAAAPGLRGEAMRPASTIGVGAVGTLGYALTAFGVGDGPVVMALRAAGVGLMAVFVGCATVGWSLRVRREGDLRRSLLLCACAFAVGDILLGVFALMPADASTVLVGLPLASMLLAWALDRKVEPDNRGAAAHAGAAESGGSRDVLMLGTALVYFNSFFALVLGLWQGGGSGTSRVGTAAFTCLVMVVLAVLCVRVGRSRSLMHLMATAMLVIYLGSLLVLSIALSRAYDFDVQIWVAAGISFKALAWLAVLGLPGRTPAAYVRQACLYGALLVAVPFAISLSGPWSRDTLLTWFASEADVQVVAQVALFAVAAGSIVWLSARARGGSPNASSRLDGGRLSPSESLAVLAQRVGLSDRECQIVSFLQRGYNARAIAEELLLSEHTVNNHVASVYRKASVHSRQELISLLEELGRGESNRRPI